MEWAALEALGCKLMREARGIYEKRQGQTLDVAFGSWPKPAAEGGMEMKRCFCPSVGSGGSYRATDTFQPD